VAPGSWSTPYCRIVSGGRGGPAAPRMEVTMDVQTGESYPRLRELLGEDGFAELAHLIRKTYEANEARRRRPARRSKTQASPGA
jgi:hypothetical protein